MFVMASIRQVKEGLDILAKYTKDLDNQEAVQTENDFLNITVNGPEPHKMDLLDAQRMYQNDWSWDSCIDCWKIPG